MQRRAFVSALGTALLTPAALIGCAEIGTGYDVTDTPREGAIAWPADRARTALVLGSGGPRGFAHVGVLKALEAQGIEPSLIVGASAGAIVGALYAARLAAREIEALALDLGVRQIADPAIWRPNRLIGRALQDTIVNATKIARIEDLPRPFVAVAASVSGGKLVAFTKGHLGAAVRASAALPSMFLPVTVAGELYEDGDMVSPVPIRVARRLGATRVVAVDVSAWVEDEPAQAYESWRKRDAERRAIITDEALDADYVLRIRLPYYAGASREYRENVIALGETQTLAATQDIRKLLAA
ncbi:MAG: patatin [Burkholderiales bacterium]|nr:MAG: patatin [Burkholderiales bacterium]TAG80501.1 MAG: patatin [Betaproteobacteria bacterium]